MLSHSICTAIKIDPENTKPSKNGGPTTFRLVAPEGATSAFASTLPGWQVGMGVGPFLNAERNVAHYFAQMQRKIGRVSAGKFSQNTFHRRVLEAANNNSPTVIMLMPCEILFS